MFCLDVFLKEKNDVDLTEEEALNTASVEGTH
jgi:hypothetical protein